MLTVFKILQWLILSLLLIAATAAFGTWLLTWHPAPLVPVAIRGEKAPLLPRDRPLKIMSWNVQYMAGKNYVFFYDLLDGSGPDKRPSTEDIALTLRQVAARITRENPDIVLLQEVDVGAARTDHMDQRAALLELLGPAYASSTSAYYWKAVFVPHPQIMGSVGMKLVVLSKYRIAGALRHALPLMPGGWAVQQFNIKRAILEVTLPFADGRGSLTVLNTHLDAFAQGTDTMERQVAYLRALLDARTTAGEPWILAGDFNLLMPGTSYGRLPPKQRAYFKPVSELKVLTERYRSFPSVEQADGPEHQSFYTHFPNDPSVKAPDRTIDFIFYSPDLALRDGRVDRSALAESDHLPLSATFTPPR